MAKKGNDPGHIASNRKAYHNFEILDELEAGIALQGTEVKSLRQGKLSFSDAHAGFVRGELWLYNVQINEFKEGNRFNHEPKRPRKLLLHRRQLDRWQQKIETKSLTIVPLRFYFTRQQKVKVKIGLARGKKMFDKRESLQKRQQQRDLDRTYKQRF